MGQKEAGRVGRQMFREGEYRQYGVGQEFQVDGGEEELRRKQRRVPVDLER